MPPKKWPISVCILNWKTPSGQRFSDDDIRKERQKSNWKTQMDDSRKRFLRPFFVFFFLLLFFNFLGVLVPPPLSPPSCLSKQMGHQGGECTHVHVHFFSPLPVSLFARFFFSSLLKGGMSVCLCVLGVRFLSSWEKWSVVCFCVIFCHSVTGFLVVV